MPERDHLYALIPLRFAFFDRTAHWTEAGDLIVSIAGAEAIINPPVFRTLTEAISAVSGSYVVAIVPPSHA